MAIRNIVMKTIHDVLNQLCSSLWTSRFYSLVGGPYKKHSLEPGSALGVGGRGRKKYGE